MTTRTEESKKHIKISGIKALFCILLLPLAIYFGDALKDGAIYGFKICAFNVIPTLFPFFIMADLWCKIIYISPSSPIVKIITPFNISHECADAFLIGNVCGFPLGAKMLISKYEDHLICKDELSRLLPLCTNPSLAFVVSGVGAGLLGNIKTGIMLYLSTVISAVIVYMLLNRQPPKSLKSVEKSRQTFSLVNSIINAGRSSITVSSFIIFFSSIIGLLKSLIKSEIIIALFSAFLEVGSACSIIAECGSPLGRYSLPLIAFSLSFSGISVFLQVLSFSSDIKPSEYITKKLMQGILSAFIITIFSTI